MASRAGSTPAVRIDRRIAMAAFLKLGDIKGESTDKEHKDWIIIQSMSSPIYRSIPEGARDMQRVRGETTLGDVVIVREMDKSSVKLMEACASGKFFKDVEIHFCSDLEDKSETYLKYKLGNCIVSPYSFHGTASANPLPSEEFSLNFTDVEWTYFDIDHKTGKPKGNVVGTYDPGKAASK
jgi:type VI secretion system secreted protein Hcp